MIIEMITDNWKIAEDFVAGTLPEAELNALNTRLETDPLFSVEFYDCVNMLRSLQDSGKHKQFKNLLVNIQKTEKKENASSWKVRTIPLRTHYYRTAAIAAGMALVTTLSVFSIVNNNEKRRSSQYSLLKRELETIKRSQNALIKNINEKQNSPVAQANYSGTGFALSNDGYFITNYHVTEGADSVYIQNRDGEYFKASLVAIDAQSDLAILKVDNKHFRFGKTDVPYIFAPSKKQIGTKIFTLGYPQDEIVYNEGYISAKNGYEGDSIQYRLEVPANPGQSGSPVMDANGNVVAIISGKESETEGTTFAVGTKAINNLVNSLPKSAKLSLPKNNKLNHLTREQQIEKMEYYTCSVKVYKK